MKTSYILLATIALLALTGMVATDVLLKQQYEKIDWHNSYQNFVSRNLPSVKHWVIEGAPTDEILMTKTSGASQALVHPEYDKFYRVRQQGDTAYVAFTPDYDNYHNDPIEDADHQLPVRLLLRVPDIQTLQTKTARLTIADLTTDQIRIYLENSRLRTNKLVISGLMHLQESHNSFTLLGKDDQLASLQLAVQDSSGVHLDDTPISALAMQTSPKAKVFLQGQTLKWLQSK